jgi:integrase
LIQSRKGDNKPISRIQAYRVLNEVAEQLGLEEVGTHTMRKTFGYHHYKKNHDVAILQDIFNHSAPSITLRYIGITDDEKDNSLKDFDL